MTGHKKSESFQDFPTVSLLSELIGIRRRYYSDIAGTILQQAAKAKAIATYAEATIATATPYIRYIVLRYLHLF